MFYLGIGIININFLQNGVNGLIALSNVDLDPNGESGSVVGLLISVEITMRKAEPVKAMNSVNLVGLTCLGLSYIKMFVFVVDCQSVYVGDGYCDDR